MPMPIGITARRLRGWARPLDGMPLDELAELRRLLVVAFVRRRTEAKRR